jgi:hypothetical protein
MSCSRLYNHPRRNVWCERLALSITETSQRIFIRRRTQSMSGLINLEGISFDNSLIVPNSNVIEIPIISLSGAIRFLYISETHLFTVK